MKILDKARKLTEFYNNPENSERIVGEDIYKIYKLVESAATDGRNSVVLGSSELPTYFYYDVMEHHGISKERLNLLRSRRTLLMATFYKDGFIVSEINDSRWILGKTVELRWD